MTNRNAPPTIDRTSSVARWALALILLFVLATLAGAFYQLN